MATQIDTSTYADATGAAAQTLVQAAPSDGSVVLVYMGANGPVLATAQSPYTTFATQGVGAATTRNGQALAVRSDDGLDVLVQSPSLNAYWFHYARSGNAWSASNNGHVTNYNSGSNGEGVSAGALVDPQGRLWLLGVDDVVPGGPWDVYAAYTANDAPPFTDSANTPTALGELNLSGMAAAIVGNYLVLVYDSGGGHLTATRLDVSGASLGAWRTPSTIAGASGITTASVLALAAVPGGTDGVLVYTTATGVEALTYHAATDTWDAAPVALSSTAGDRHASLAPGPSGVVYAVWSSASGALVGAGYRAAGGGWDASPTTLVAASGATRAWPHAAYLPASTTLALLWTEGAASPYGVEFTTVAAPTASGGGGGGSLTGSAALVGTGSLGAGGVLTGAAGAAGVGVLAASGVLQGVAALVGVGSVHVAPAPTNTVLYGARVGATSSLQAVIAATAES